MSKRVPIVQKLYTTVKFLYTPKTSQKPQLSEHQHFNKFGTPHAHQRAKPVKKCIYYFIIKR